MSVANSIEASAGIEWRSFAAVKRLAVDLYREFSRDRLTNMAAAVAYHTIFALPAVIVLTVMAAAVLNRATDIDMTTHLRDLIRDHAPASTRDLLNEQVNRAIADVDGGGLSIGIVVAALLALWSGSNAVGSLLEAFNLAYGVDETRSFKRRKATTLGLTLLLAVTINLAFALLVFGERIGRWFADLLGAGDLFNLLWNVSRWPAAIAVVAAILAVMYHVGPNVPQSFRLVTPGGILATVLWLVATAGFGIYLRFSNPGSAYGIVGSVLVLLFFLYVTAIIFLLGAELNALLAGERPVSRVVDIS